MKVMLDSNVPYVAPRVSRQADVEIRKGAEIGAPDLKGKDALIVSTRTRTGEALLKGSGVKLVATGSIGVDHIDAEWCENNGIEVVNAPGCNAPAVAQYVICSLAAAGFDFKNGVLGIVGKGNIGGLLAQILRRAGGTVLVCDPPRAEAGYDDEEYMALDDLLQEADAVTFHVPLIRDGKHPTYHLLNADRIDMLRPEAIVINASRGGVVDEEALLEKGNDLTLIIDTWEGEPAFNPRMMEQAFIATQHIAGYSEAGKQRAARSVIEALNRKFKLKITTEGLADYDFRHNPPLLEEVVGSYDPMIDTKMLKSHPDLFEYLRNSYIFRKERREEEA